MSEIRDAAKDHLWLHFANVPEAGPILFERGEGCRLWDSDGKRYLDALSGLFVTAIGHGRSDLAKAGAQQAETLAYYPVWGAAHPPAARLAAKLAALAPGDMDRVFFTTGGSEAVESAWKLARQYFLARGEPDRVRVIARTSTYHGTTLGALSITGVPSLRAPFEPLLNDLVTHVGTTDEPDAAEQIDRAIREVGPKNVAAVYLEPVQNSGGCYTPHPGYWQRVREICDEHGVLLVSDEVICAFGRLGTWFGGQKFDYVPDMITFAKGVTSGYAPLGGVITRPHIAETLREAGDAFVHGITFGGHPVSCAVGLANVQALEDEGVIENVQRHEAYLREGLSTLLEHPIAAELRGAGYFYAIELQKDPATGTPFDPQESLEIVDTLKPILLELGLIARADGRRSPILQYAPPLIAGRDEIDEMVRLSREALDRAWKKMNG